MSVEDRVSSIVPVYEKSLLGGYFAVTFETNDTFKLPFSSFLKSQFERDEKLRTYVRSRSDGDSEDYDVEITATGVVKDLYDIGCPVDEWVEDYFTIMKSKISKFEALLQLFNHLKTFGDDSGSR